MSMIPSQKTGTDVPRKEKLVITRSSSEFLLTALITPRGIASVIESVIAEKAAPFRSPETEAEEKQRANETPLATATRLIGGSLALLQMPVADFFARQEIAAIRCNRLP